MTTSQIILVIIVYVLLIAIIEQLIYACVDMVLDSIKHHECELVGFTITMFGIMIASIVVIGLLPVIC